MTFLPFQIILLFESLKKMPMALFKCRWGFSGWNLLWSIRKVWRYKMQSCIATQGNLPSCDDLILLKCVRYCECWTWRAFIYALRWRRSGLIERGKFDKFCSFWTDLIIFSWVDGRLLEGAGPLWQPATEVYHDIGFKKWNNQPKNNRNSSWFFEGKIQISDDDSDKVISIDTTLNSSWTCLKEYEVIRRFRPILGRLRSTEHMMFMIIKLES